MAGFTSLQLVAPGRRGLEREPGLDEQPPPLEQVARELAVRLPVAHRRHVGPCGDPVGLDHGLAGVRTQADDVRLAYRGFETGGRDGDRPLILFGESFRVGEPKRADPDLLDVPDERQ